MTEQHIVFCQLSNQSSGKSTFAFRRLRIILTSFAARDAVVATEGVSIVAAVRNNLFVFWVFLIIPGASAIGHLKRFVTRNNLYNWGGKKNRKNYTYFICLKKLSDNVAMF